MNIITDVTALQGWAVDFYKLRKYLSDKYGVTDAFVFLGHIPENQKLYSIIRQAGFKIRFKEIAYGNQGEIKGNVDVLLTAYVLDTVAKYDQAILITADGDFADLVKVLKRRKKFKLVMSPSPHKITSYLLRPQDFTFTIWEQSSTKYHGKQKGTPQDSPFWHPFS